MITLKEQFEHFCKLHIPTDTPEHQMKDIKDIFYGGAASVLDIQETVSKVKDKEYFNRTFKNVVQEITDFYMKKDEK